MLTKLFLDSKDYWPKSFGFLSSTNDCTFSKTKLEPDIVQLAKCYDMASFAFYFHDSFPNLKNSNKTRTNSVHKLQLLLGDYFLIKSLHGLAPFGVKLYSKMAQVIVKFSEGESLSLTKNVMSNDDHLHSGK